MDIVHALILGIVEGVTEFLPISSTGHLILTSHLLGLAETNFLKSFEIIIQLGAICAVVVIYWRRLFLSAETFKKVSIAFIPTAVIGLVFYDLVKKYLLGSVSVVLWALLLGGLGILLFEYVYKRKSEAGVDFDHITYPQAIAIGVFQSLAIIPGVSRAAATIIGGLGLGIDRKAIVDFSFLLAIPTMCAATALDLIKNADTFSSDQFSFLTVGFVSAFIMAFISIRFLLRFISHRTFNAFGVYRILIALAFWFFIL